jgi:hypothetical protein
MMALSSAASCGKSAAPTTPTPGGTFTITVMRRNGAQSFSPNPADAGGQMAVFRNADTIVHHVRLNDLSVDTGDLRQVRPAGRCPCQPAAPTTTARSTRP